MFRAIEEIDMELTCSLKDSLSLALVNASNIYKGNARGSYLKSHVAGYSSLAPIYKIPR